jgi:hypothetical protein
MLLEKNQVSSSLLQYSTPTYPTSNELKQFCFPQSTLYSTQAYMAIQDDYLHLAQRPCIDLTSLSTELDINMCYDQINPTTLRRDFVRAVYWSAITDLPAP